MKILSIVCFLIFSSGIYAQANNIHQNYTRIGLGAAYGVGNMNHTNVNLNVTLETGLIVSFLRLKQFRIAPETPDDYRGGGIFASSPPLHEINTIGIALGKSFVNAGGVFKYNLQGGVLIGESLYPYQFKPYNSTGWFGTNYTYQIDKNEVFGLLVQPGIEILFSRYVGLKLGALANINAIYNTYAFEFGLVFGALRKKL